LPGRRVAGSVKRAKVVDHPDVGRAAVIWLATPTLTTPSWLCAAPTVGRLHSGFEQRYPARFASVSIVRSVKSSLTFRPLSEDQSGPCLGGHLKTGQLGSPQNRPVRRPSSRTRISFTLSVAVLASLSASVVPGSSLPLPASGGEL